MREDNTTNRAAWRKKLTSYTGDPTWWDKPGTNRKKIHIRLVGVLPLIFSCSL